MGLKNKILCRLEVYKLNSMIFSRYIISFFFFLVYSEYDHGEKINVIEIYITKQEVFREVDLAVWLFFLFRVYYAY
jgi:hypothetical protein